MSQPTTVLPTVVCARVPVSPVTRQRAAETVVRLAQAPLRQGADVHLCNAYTLACADEDSTLLDVLRGAAINFPDGMSVVWANALRYRLLALPRERVYGPDLFLDVLWMGQAVGLRHYLLGSTPKVLADVEGAVGRRFPTAQVVGRVSPPFRRLSAEEWRQQVEVIRGSDAQIVWVALGTPQQDHEVARLAAELPMVCVAVGAAFDFVAGTKRQAPPALQRLGLEWLFRLCTEPRRLWRRYLFGNARFLRAAVRGNHP